jgi:transcriptional regulator with XRE-family HTH domain
MRSRKRMKLTDQIREAIEQSGVSRYRIAQETGIDQSTISKFMLGHRGLSMEALDAIADELGLEVVVKSSRKREA